MNQTAIACGVEAVRDKEYFEEHVRKIIETREWAKEELKNLGFRCLDSKSNFIFAMHPDYDAKELFEALKRMISMCASGAVRESNSICVSL